MHQKGFTLIELLLVLGILAILSAIVLVAINPTKQLVDAKNVSRNAAIREIENALSQYVIDKNTLAELPVTISIAKDICQTTVTGTDCTDAPVNGYDLSVLSPTYLTSIPMDPTQTGSTITGYRIYRFGSFNRVCSPVLDAGCGI